MDSKVLRSSFFPLSSPSDYVPHGMRPLIDEVSASQRRVISRGPAPPPRFLARARGCTRSNVSSSRSNDSVAFPSESVPLIRAVGHGIDRDQSETLDREGEIRQEADH